MYAHKPNRIFHKTTSMTLTTAILQSPSRRPSIARVLVLILLTICIQSCSGSQAPELAPGSVIPLSEVFTGNFALTDHNGLPRNNQDFRGKPVLVYFGFTSCPDVCPAALSILSAALNEMGGKADQFEVLFIALDPERDTVTALKNYLSFDHRLLGLTGTKEEIEAAKAGFKVYSQKQDLPDSALGYTINHSSFFYLINEHGTPTFAIKDTLAPQDLAAFSLYQAGL